METFQRYILIISIVVLCVILVFVGMSVKYSTIDNWPPITPDCPDYWTADGSGNCINTNNLGTCPATGGAKHLSMNFNVSPYVGVGGACQKHEWADKCGVYWDGVNYGVSNPCDPQLPK